ncbi:T9SS type A sorting domain-containing protein [uncultured Polaribacter sp.]|uniref:T9SS type A sorting domain-containing protein n=1 Tax=uncultured Polaribacter sp. TaxID=174711 RepID=UPI0026387A16|nr:T9SS type A sorting domain-containing protein [uncultured Polaribacter sp.]
MNDGDLDWACTGKITSFPGAPRLTLIYENKNGVFIEKYRFPAGSGMKLAVIDLDVDGYKGLAVMGSGWADHEHHIAMYTNTEGVFNEWTDHPFHSESTMPQPSWGNGFNGGEFIVTDMNNDGKMDLIIVGRATFYPFVWGNYKAQYYKNTTQSLSTQDLQLEQVTLYPNPTRGKISLKLPSGNELDKFMVYDSTGRIIGQSTNGTNYFDMQPYATGFYYLRYQTKSSKTGKIKFLKQ